MVVFSTAFRFPAPHYETCFLSEYIAWMCFSQTTVNAMVSVAWNGPLMKRVFVPRTIFPISSTLAGLVNFSLSPLVLVVIMAIVGAPIHATILFLPVSLAIRAGESVGIVGNNGAGTSTLLRAAAPAA